MGHKCRLCKDEIFVTIDHDTDGYYVTEHCGCKEKGPPPRRHFCDIPEYAEELKRRIVAAGEILLKEIGNTIPVCGVADIPMPGLHNVENVLATMPGKNELRSTLLATFMAPMQSLVAQLNAPSQNFAYLLDARVRQQKTEG